MNESSLSRIWKLAQKHDIGTISAFRSAKECGEGRPYTKKENLKRSFVLKAKLLKLGYGVTKISGTYIEGFGSDTEQKPQKEESYLVVDINDKGTLKKDLITLGLMYQQDSITYQNKDDGIYYLISSNRCKNGYPGYGKIGVEKKLGSAVFGKSGEFHSRVKGRPFVFGENTTNFETLLTKSIGEIRSITEFAKIMVD